MPNYLIAYRGHPRASSVLMIEDYFLVTGVGVSISCITVLSCWSFVLCFCWMYLVLQTYRIVAIYLQYLKLGKSTKLIWSVFFPRNLHNPLLIFTYLLMPREQGFTFYWVGLGNKLCYMWQPCVLCMFVWPEPCASCRAENPTHCVTHKTLGLCTSIYFWFLTASEEGK